MNLKNHKYPCKSLQRLIISVLLMISIGVTFWTSSRYPDLFHEYKRAFSGNFINRVIGVMSKNESISSVNAQTSQINNAVINTLNWLDENKEGMIFGLIFAACLMLFFQQLYQYNIKILQSNNKNNIFIGLILGSGLGLCTNCTTPIGISLNKSGVSLSTVLTMMVASPALNPISVILLFMLFPFDMAIIRMLLLTIVIAIFIPLIIKKFKHNCPKSKNFPMNADLLGYESVYFSTYYCFKNLFIYFLKISIFIVPIMLLLALLMGVLTTFLPLQSFILIDSYQWWNIILASIIGVILPIPMLFDLVIVYLLIQLGISHSVCMVLLFTLPVVSIFSTIVLGKMISWKISLSLFITLFLLGITGGFFIKQMEEAKLYHSEYL